MAILPLPQQLQQAKQQREMQKDQSFFTGLMQYGMNPGEFDMVGDEPVFTPGEAMPDKTTAWNQFIASKQGRLSPQDLMQFETGYEGARQVRYQNQLKQLDKLRLQGADPGDIQDMVEDDPALYESLLDTVSELQKSGTEEGMAAAAQAMQYIPDKSPGMLESAIGTATENPLLAIGGGVAAYKGGSWALGKWGPGLKEKLLADPGAQALVDAEIKAGTYKIDKNGNWVYAKNTRVTTGKGKKRKTTVKKAGSRVHHWADEHSRLSGLSGAAKERSMKNLLKKGGGVGGSLGLFYAPEIVGALGGGEGTQQAAAGVAGVGLGGMALKKFIAAAAARHGSAAAGGWGANPWVQAGLGLVDLYFAYQMLRDHDVI
jgi:hypothetical protein